MRSLKASLVLTAAIFAVVPASRSLAANVVYGAPGYTTSGGYRGSPSSISANPGQSVASTGSNGLTIANESFFSGSTNATVVATRGLVINPNATNGYTLLNQVPGAVNQTYTPIAINTLGSLIAGTAQVSTANPNSTGATVWTIDGTAYVLPLPTYPGNTNNVAPNATGRAVNNAGTVVGSGQVFNGNTLLNSGGAYAYFNAGSSTTPSYSSGTPVNLQAVNSQNSGYNGNYSALVNGITTSGVAAGQSSAAGNGSNAVVVPTYWSVGNSQLAGPVAGNAMTVTVPSGFSNTSSTGASSSGVSNVSPTGYAVGSIALYTASAPSTAVFYPTRWNSLSSTPGEVLGLPSGAVSGNTAALNDVGDALGTSSTATQTIGALWKAGSNSPISLATVSGTTAVANPGNVIVASPSFTTRGINDAGFSVGFATNSAASTTPVDALAWNPGGGVVELNSLVTLTPQTGTSAQTVGTTNFAALPTYGTAGWVSLIGAFGITNDGWISGVGIYYDPAAVAYTSSGNPAPMSTYGNGTYYRAFEMQVLTSQLPEPASLAAIFGGATLMFGRRRASR